MAAVALPLPPGGAIVAARIARLTVLLGLLVFRLSGTATAGSFSVSPLRIQLDATHPTSAFHVRNDSDERIVVQIRAADWRQASDGADIYEPSNDIALFPKIVEIDRGEEKSVRIGVETASGSRERALRVYFDELPVTRPGETAVRLALRLGVPVFVAPPNGRGAVKIDTVDVRDGSLEVRVRNDGNAHVMARRITAVGGRDDGSTVFRHEQAGWYVLAGAARTFRVPIPREECERAPTIRAEVEIEDSRPPERESTLEAKIGVPRSSCGPDSLHAGGSHH